MPLNSVLAGLNLRLPIAGFILVLIGCTQNDEFSWLQRQWVSDIDASRLANPHIQELPIDIRNKWWDSYGEIRWNISDGVAKITRNDEGEISTTYTIEASDDGEAVMVLITEDGLRSSSFIWQTKSGFCHKTASIDYVITPEDSEEMERFYGPEDPFATPGKKTANYPRDDSIVTVECYKPYKPRLLDR